MITDDLDLGVVADAVEDHVRALRRLGQQETTAAAVAEALGLKERQVVAAFVLRIGGARLAPDGRMKAQAAPLSRVIEIRPMGRKRVPR